MIGDNPWSKFNAAGTMRPGTTPGAAAMLDRELREDTAVDISTYAGILDEIFDPATGDRWMPLFTGAGTPSGEGVHLLSTEQGLMVVRMMCRYLACENEFAINAIENRISYIVGTGMKLTLQVRDKRRDDPEDPAVKADIEDVQSALDDELDRVNFDALQEETVRRADRDGEVFIRVFHTFAGVEYRFIEPRDVRSDDSHGVAPFGVECDPNDVTNVKAYWIAGEGRVPAEEIYHLKLNVDGNVRRGIPTLWPIRKNLHRAGKLLKCVSMQAQFQASIGAIREHEVGDAATVRRFADDRANYTLNDPATGESRRLRKINPGTVIDSSNKVKWTFPSVGVGVDKLLLAFSADLRSAASRLVMPEYMLTSDASNGTYSSLLAADGPTYRMFTRAQRRFSRFFADVGDDPIAAKIKTGELPADTLERFRVVAVPPEIATRDPKADAETKEIRHRNGVLSKRTWQIQDGLDPETEDRQNAEDAARTASDLPPVDPLDPNAPPPGDQDDPTDPDAPPGGGTAAKGRQAARTARGRKTPPAAPRRNSDA